MKHTSIFLALLFVSLSGCATKTEENNTPLETQSESSSTTTESSAEFSVEEGLSTEDVSPSFMTTFKSYREHPIAEQNLPIVLTDGSDGKLTLIKQIKVDNCPPVPDGVCGYTLQILGARNWDTNATQFYYIATTAGGPLEYYGSFSGNLTQIYEELANVSSLTEL